MPRKKQIGDQKQKKFLQAVRENDASTVRTLISDGIHPDSDLYATERPLFLAAKDGCVETVNTLIAGGADVSFVDNEGNTALSSVLAIVCQQVESYQESHENEDDIAAFWQELFLEAHVQIARVLLRANCHVDIENRFVNRFFMDCCEQGQTAVVKEMLDCGVDPNTKSEVEMTALWYALSRPEIFRLLVQYGANVKKICSSDTIILYSLLADNAFELAQLLVDRGADVNQGCLLKSLAEEGKADAVKFLLEHGVDPGQGDDNGETALQLARREGHRDTVLILREAVGLPTEEQLRAASLVRQNWPQEKSKLSIWQRLVRSLHKKNFRRDEREILLRCWWLAHKVSNVVVASYDPSEVSHWAANGRSAESEQKLFIELLAYTTSFVLSKLREDIEKIHGDTNQTDQSYVQYWVRLGVGLDQAFGLREHDKSVFIDLLQSYDRHGYDEDYESFWAICENPDDILEKTIAESLAEAFQPLPKNEYNAERNYVYRANRIVNVVDPARATEMILSYRNVGLQFYEKAFFEIGAARIERELRELQSRTLEREGPLYRA